MQTKQSQSNREKELKRLRRKLLQKILDRENKRRAARAFMAG
jgi:hypothetical protein